MIHQTLLFQSKVIKYKCLPVLMLALCFLYLYCSSWYLRVPSWHLLWVCFPLLVLLEPFATPQNNSKWHISKQHSMSFCIYFISHRNAVWLVSRGLICKERAELSWHRWLGAACYFWQGRTSVGARLSLSDWDNQLSSETLPVVW